MSPAVGFECGCTAAHQRKALSCKLSVQNADVLGGAVAGAGKTFTMEGMPQDPGINYRTMKELFRWGPPLDPEYDGVLVCMSDNCTTQGTTTSHIQLGC